MAADLLLSIDPNPNCDAVDGMLYHALESPQLVGRMRVSRQGVEVLCWVTGVEPDGRWVPAHAYKITDSGSGVAYLIAGGAWGLRFAPGLPPGRAGDAPPRWDLRDPAQWGEPYKIYGDTKDLVFGPGRPISA